MRLSFRRTLIVIVGISALAFVVIIAATAFLSSRVERELTNIQQRYVPKVELGPQLGAQMERIHRSFQDAVSARDTEMLAGTREMKNRFLAQLAAAGDVVEPADAAALRSAIDKYYEASYEVSRRIIAGETGEPLVEAMASMQAEQTRAAELLKRTTTFDKNELTAAFTAATKALTSSARIRLAISVACVALVILLSVWLIRGVLGSVAELTAGLRRFGKGDFAQPVVAASGDELGEVAQQANEMAASLRSFTAARDRADWLKGGLAGLASELRGELPPSEVGSRAVRFLARYLDAPVGALYYLDRERVLRLLGQYALSTAGAQAEASFRPPEGLVGQAALEDQVVVINEPPADYLRIRSGLGEGAPRVLVFLPLVHAGKVTGVLELALLKPWPELATELFLSVREALAIAIEVAIAREAARELLAETQRQAQRLAKQEEELRASNEELQAQQEELQQTNEELRHQAEELDAQRLVLQEKNLELDKARRNLEHQKEELTTVSAYKSQFLANMSHELRTPLNSMLLLSNLLADNEAGNLTAKQAEFARTIHSAGRDLLALINQVLDLAKVESGKQEVRSADVPLADLAAHARRVFEPLAQDKGLRFIAEVEPGLPESISTDRQRLEQILNNLIGNAIKFTERGEVRLRIAKPDPGVRFRRLQLQPDQVVAFSVSDNGIGIAPENQERIFLPFEQVQAAPDRRHGGTGLGLSIARESSALLGGELHLHSALGKGSTFTCYLPYQSPSPAVEKQISGDQASRSVRPSQAGKAILASADSYLLIVEDDSVFANTFGEIIASQGFKYVVAPDGQTGLRLARELKPTGIILDVELPDIDGWKVLQQLQADPATAAIPVHFVSAGEGAARSAALGAVGHLTKPATKRDLLGVIESLAPQSATRPVRVLVVEQNKASGDSLLKQLAAEKVELQRATSAREALQALKSGRFDCMILDLSLPGVDGLELLQSVEAQCDGRMPAVVVYTARALGKEEARRLQAYAEAVVMKGPAEERPSKERLVNEIRLFVRRLKEGSAAKGQTAPRLHPADVHLIGRKVLLVEDDMRTLYALSATLQAKGMNVLAADTGRAALRLLAEHPDLEAVLMDMMLPEMDGYEAMRHIRREERFRKLPIIALTAKAMKGDREKCLEAGATGYLPKPIDSDLLVAMLHSYLSGKTGDGDEEGG